MVVALFRSKMRDGADIEEYKKLSMEMVELCRVCLGLCRMSCGEVRVERR